MYAAPQPRSGLWNPEVAADLADQKLFDLTVTWHRGTPVVRWIAPPRVIGTLADQDTSVTPKVGDHLMTLQTAMLTSSYVPWQAARASARFISRASCRADRRFSSNSSRVSP